MVVLDTDHMTLLEWHERPDSRRLRNRLNQVSEAEAATSIISYEEQLRGWLSALKQAKDLSRRIDVYSRLRKQLANYCRIVVLDFDERAATEFQRLGKMRLKLKKPDLMIAAIARANNATLLTRNLSDFRRVPGLAIEDWTR